MAGALLEAHPARPCAVPASAMIPREFEAAGSYARRRWNLSSSWRRWR